MKILIIGNGFDLAHKLPTSYSSFLDFVSYCESFRYNVNHKGEYYDFCVVNNNEPLFDEISECCTNNKLLDWFLRIYGWGVKTD